MLAVLLATASLARNSGPPTRISFAPPDGTTYVRNTRRRRTRTITIDRSRQTEDYVQSTRHIFKKTPAGYDEQRTVQWTAEASDGSKARFRVVEAVKSRFQYEK